MTHMTELCITCTKMEHKFCSAVMGIEDAAKEIYSDSHGEKIQQSVNDLLTGFIDYKTKADMSNDQLFEKKQMVIGSVRSVRNAINEHLDKLEVSALADIDRAFTEEKMILEDKISVCNAAISFLNESISTFNLTMSVGNNEERFMEINKITQKTNLYCSMLQELYMEIYSLDVTIEEDNSILHSLSQSFGTVNVAKTSLASCHDDTKIIYTGEIRFRPRMSDTNTGDENQAGEVNEQNEEAENDTDNTEDEEENASSDGEGSFQISDQAESDEEELEERETSAGEQELMGNQEFNSSADENEDSLDNVEENEADEEPHDAKEESEADDCFSPLITSFDVLPDRRSLLLDSNNKRLLMYGKNNIYLTEKTLSDLPDDYIPSLNVLSNTTCALSTNSEKLIYVRISDDLAMSETDINHNITAMSKYGDKMIAVLQLENITRVCEMTDYNTVKRIIIKDDGTLFEIPCNIAVSADHSTVYIVDMAKGCIGLSFAGNVLFQFQNTEIGSYFGLAVDSDYLFVGTEVEGNWQIQRLSTSGVKQDILQTGRSFPLKVVQNELILCNIDDENMPLIQFHAMLK